MTFAMPSLIQILRSVKSHERNWRNLLTGRFGADYEYSISVGIAHEKCQQCAMINDMFDKVNEQTVRDW